MLLFWIFLIIVIVVIVKKEKQQQEEINQRYENRKTPGLNRAGGEANVNNSYYTKEKVRQYNKMEQDHALHGDEVDISSKIGYKRCPKCDTLVSLKSSECFMCDYVFDSKKD